MQRTILHPMFLALALLAALSLACSLLGADQPADPLQPAPTGEQPTLEVEQPPATQPPLDQPSPTYDVEFPLPEDVRDLIQTDTGQVNFQTGLSLEQTIDFYRGAFAAQGLSERQLLTAISETTFSLVFDGDPEGAIVVQGVDLGNGTVNVNIRHEDV